MTPRLALTPAFALVAAGLAAGCDAEGGAVDVEEKALYEELDVRSPTEIYVRGRMVCPFAGPDEAGDERPFTARYDGRAFSFLPEPWASRARTYRCVAPDPDATVTPAPSAPARPAPSEVGRPRQRPHPRGEARAKAGLVAQEGS